jgi:ferritin-like metal-binding protein YciE
MDKILNPFRLRHLNLKPWRGVNMFGKVKSLRELFEIEMYYAYDCEQKLADKGLPSMIENVISPELREALEKHLTETQNHVTRLEQVFGMIGTEPKSKANDILGKMLDAAEDSISNIEESSLSDAALIVNGNIVEHYEIALYGSLVSFARRLGLQNAASILQETLAEEKKADAKLTEIGEAMVNLDAARGQTA